MTLSPDRLPIILTMWFPLAVHVTHTDSYLVVRILGSRVSQFDSEWLHILYDDSLLVQVLVVLGSSHGSCPDVYKSTLYPRVGP